MKRIKEIKNMSIEYSTYLYLFLGASNGFKECTHWHDAIITPLFILGLSNTTDTKFYKLN